MAQLLTARDVWPEIRRSARGAKSRHVAVAYLGDASPKMLALRPGDTLVANLGEAAIRNGSTSVRAAKAFFSRGVHLCNAEELHAKLFVFDDTVIVGSANASKNSATTLFEAAVKITDPRFATKARKAIQSVAGQTVTPAYLRLCARWRKESEAARRRLKRFRRKKLRGKRHMSRIWLFSSEPSDFTTRRQDDRKAQQRIKVPREFIREPLAWSRAPSLGPQDQVIIAHLEGERLEVLPPSRFLARGKANEGNTIIYVEQPRSPRVAPKAEFRKLVRRAFRTRRKEVPTRHIPRAWVPEFLQLWPKGYSATRSRR